MSHPVIRHLFKKTALGRIAACNARAGSALGLHSVRSVISLMRQVQQEISGHGGSVAAKDVIDSLRRMRFPPGLLRTVAPLEVGCHARCVPNLNGTLLATVKTLRNLHYIMAEKDNPDVRSLISQAANGTITPLQEEQLIGLSRTFTFAGHQDAGDVRPKLGGNILWFTTLDEIRRLQFGCKDQKKIPDRLRDALGLVEQKAGTWLTLVIFPGSVAQNRGHYRPVFCDADFYRRFMVRSSKADPTDLVWGQTADLSLLENDHVVFDGAPERVVPALSAEDFTGQELTFEVLGPLKETRGIDDETDYRGVDGKTDGLFAEKLYQLNQMRRRGHAAP